MRQLHSFFPVDSMRAALTASLWFGAVTLLSGSCMAEEVLVGLVHVSGLLDQCAVKQCAPQHSTSRLHFVPSPYCHSDDSSYCCWHAWFLLSGRRTPCYRSHSPPSLHPSSRISSVPFLSSYKAIFLCAFCLFPLTCVRWVQQHRSGRSQSLLGHSLLRILPWKGGFFSLGNWGRKRGKKARNWE